LTPQILERIIHVSVTDYLEMVHMATMTEKGIKAATAYHITRKRTRSAGTSSTPPPKKQATSSSVGSQGRRNTPPS
jgi:hypothetical protein